MNEFDYLLLLTVQPMMRSLHILLVSI